MQYQLTEEQDMLRDTVRRLAKEKVEPGASERDEKGEFDWETAKLLAENGLFGIDIPRTFGGSGFGFLALCIAIEELSRSCGSTGTLLLAHDLGLTPILLAGNNAQKEKYLPKLASGESIAAFGLTEPAAGSDVASLKLRAVKKGTEYVLNGTKTFITNGGIADVITVYAVTDPQVKTTKSASVFIVEKDMPGFFVGKHESKMGIRASDTSELIFEDCRVPQENLLGEEGIGFSLVMKTLDFTRTTVGAQGLGIAQGALDYATSYAKERMAFGESIMSFQGVSFKLADMVIKIVAARQLVYKSAAMLQDLPKDLSRLAKEVITYSSAAKAFASDVAMEVTTEAVQILGGYGYIKEYPVERMMRDAKITQIYEGTNEIQRMIIANNL
ncbi:MAG: acyl-CoA dehydrogenase family protein [Thermodesulfobacteriota bacterium]|nr:acyl-CoA dehydrogenase family protein [Thermodesulfobacteriota bacterium]